MLWGSDGIWRSTLIVTMPSGSIVFWEHVILVVASGSGAVGRLAPELP